MPLLYIDPPLGPELLHGGLPGRINRVEVEKRRYPLKELVADHGEGIHVHLAVIWLVPEHLGRHVSVRPRLARHFVPLSVHVSVLGFADHKGLGEAEICNFDDARLLHQLTPAPAIGGYVAPQHQVGGLQVAMDDLAVTAGMQVRLRF